MNLLRPFDTAPSVIGSEFGDPLEPADARVIEMMPSIDWSRISRLVFVVFPQVPDCSPVAIFSMPRFVVYVLGIAYLSMQQGQTNSATANHPQTPKSGSE